MTTRRQAGMTLIEVLIAISLLSLLSLGMLFTIRAADAHRRYAHQVSGKTRKSQEANHSLMRRFRRDGKLGDAASRVALEARPGAHAVPSADLNREVIAPERKEREILRPAPREHE